MSNTCSFANSPSWLQRGAGVLLHVSSLPGQYGIGTLGVEARQFIEFLSCSGFTFWQTCPIGPTGFGDSPYQVFCSSAGNPYFIDWEPISAVELLDDQDLGTLRELPKDRVDYGSLYNEFYNIARKTFSNFQSKPDLLEIRYGKFEIFKNKFSWLKPFACYQTLKSLNSNNPWWMWEPEFRQLGDLDKLVHDNFDEFNFHIFLQYLFSHSGLS